MINTSEDVHSIKSASLFLSQVFRQCTTDSVCLLIFFGTVANVGFYVNICVGSVSNTFDLLHNDVMFSIRDEHFKVIQAQILFWLWKSVYFACTSKS